jgi:hypothetical protein
MHLHSNRGNIPVLADSYEGVESRPGRASAKVCRGILKTTQLPRRRVALDEYGESRSLTQLVGDAYMGDG